LRMNHQKLRAIARRDRPQRNAVLRQHEVKEVRTHRYQPESS
jgi:hypothetical protein